MYTVYLTFDTRKKLPHGLEHTSWYQFYCVNKGVGSKITLRKPLTSRKHLVDLLTYDELLFAYDDLYTYTN